MVAPLLARLVYAVGCLRNAAPEVGGSGTETATEEAVEEDGGDDEGRVARLLDHVRSLLLEVKAEPDQNKVRDAPLIGGGAAVQQCWMRLHTLSNRSPHPALAAHTPLWSDSRDYILATACVSEPGRRRDIGAAVRSRCGAAVRTRCCSEK